MTASMQARVTLALSLTSDNMEDTYLCAHNSSVEFVSNDCALFLHLCRLSRILPQSLLLSLSLHAYS